MKKKSKVAAYIIVGILVFLFLTVILRFLTRAILIKKMGISNRFTEIVFMGDGQMNGEIIDDSNLQARHESEAVVTAIDYLDVSKYPFSEESTEIRDTNLDKINRSVDKYTNLVGTINDKVSDYATVHLAGYNQIMSAYSQYDSLIKWNVKNPDNIIYMNNGYLAYFAEKLSDSELDELADMVSLANTNLQNNGIPFFYFNVPSKVNPDDCQLSVSIEERENTNKNADGLLERLDAKNIKNFDFREFFNEDDRDWYSSFYVTDHHWTTTTGLWAAGKVAEVLNNEAGFSFDLNLFDLSMYEVEHFDDFFIGGLGRLDGLTNCELEGYDCLYPKNDTLFYVEIPHKGMAVEGDFKNALLDYGLLEEIGNYTKMDHIALADAYHSVLIKNFPVSIIRNKRETNNKGKKIVIIQDSFSWYSTLYLANDIDEIHVIHAQEFEGSITGINSYIRAINPDAVIMMVGEFNIAPLDLTTHTSQFDLR